MLSLNFRPFRLRKLSGGQSFYEYKDLTAGAEAGGVNVGVFGFEAVETPDEGEFEVACHVSYFHPIILTGMVNRHGL